MLEPGDLVALYSDGISEAQSVDEEEYGVERLVDSLPPHTCTAARTPCCRASSTTSTRSSATPPSTDDITLLVVKRDESVAAAPLP